VGKGPHHIITADFNGDGLLDLATADSDNATVTVLMGDGTGNFTQSAQPGVGSFPLFLRSADFNGDNIPDLVVANYGNANVSVLLGNGNGTFNGAINKGTGQSPTTLAVGDLDNDGKPDVVISNSASNNVTMLSSLSVPLQRQDSIKRTVSLGSLRGEGPQALPVRVKTVE
jgi:hypothetical protein